MTQVVNLLELSPALQARVLDGTLRVSERDLRRVVAELSWERQESLVR